MFMIRQFVRTLRSVPAYYRLPGVGWRVIPLTLLVGARYFKNALRFFWRLRVESVPEYVGDERLTVVLLSFDRIANMSALVDVFLRLPFVDRVVVSNNNPEYRIRDWVTVDDPRLELIDQPETTKPGIRFDLARERGSEYYLTVDDDIFLTPRQVHELFVHLVESPETLHGIYGQRYVGRDQVPSHLYGWRNNVSREERDVDVINRVYGLTREHLDRYFAVLEARGIEKSAEIGNGEDVLLSVSSGRSPRIHDVGPWLDCISEYDPRVALHLVLSDFMEHREGLFLELRRNMEGNLP